VTANTTWGASFASASLDAMTAYDDVLVPRLFNPWADLLLDEVGVAPGWAVLDVACGPGTVSRLAAGRVGPAGRVTGCDLSPAMLALAQTKPPVAGGGPITYRQCPADALDVADCTFDVVLCQQGLQFFPDRVAALAEMRRSLKADGRVGVAVWCAIEECPPFEGVALALGDILGEECELAYRNGPWGLADAGQLARLFGAAGFRDVDLRRHTLPVVFDGGPAQLLATLPHTSIASQMAALDERGRADLLAAAEEHLRPMLQDGQVHSSAASHVVRATA
jgi:SAM-dependent methyltransferase